MTAPDLTDAIRDEFARLSAQVVEYLTGQGWEPRKTVGGYVFEAAGRQLHWWHDGGRTFAVLLDDNHDETPLNVWSTSAQIAADHLVVAAILPESMASWASRLDEVAR